jgi:hypothetical protein
MRLMIAQIAQKDRDDTINKLAISIGDAYAFIQLADPLQYQYLGAEQCRSTSRQLIREVLDKNIKLGNTRESD